MNAILYVDRAGVPWRYLPHDFPPCATVHGSFAKWQQDGVFEQLTGRKRHLDCDTLGLLLTAIVTAAFDHGARLVIDVHPVQHESGTKGFKVTPRRWTIERSIGWLMHDRRRHLARDYETHPHRSDAVIRLAMIDLMARRLTGEATPNRRGT